jgi:hypothetical protein
MSTKAPLTLQELSMYILLKKQILAISAAYNLPLWLFLQLFKVDFACKSTEILKAMVHAWPFPHLPLGALMKT